MTESWNFDLYIDGTWTERGGGRIHRGHQPGQRGGDRNGARGVRQGRRRGHRGRPQGLRRGALAVHEAGRTSGRPGPDGGIPRGTCRRAPRADRRRDRLGRLPHRLRPGGGLHRDVPVQRHPDRARLRVGRGGCADGRTRRHGGIGPVPRAGRGGGRHHALQLPVHAQRRQGRPGPGRRLHRRAEAPPVDPARRLPDRPAPPRKPASHRACSTSSPGTGTWATK